MQDFTKDQDPAIAGYVNSNGFTATLREIEARYILMVIAANGGDKTKAAKVLKIDRRTLYRRLAAFKS